MFVLMNPSSLLVSILAAAAYAADFPAADLLHELPALPDPLAMRDGGKVTTKEDWLTKRAPELRGLFEHYMYGARPPAPRAVEGKVIREDRAALGGKATL